jgi:hypothetical protein
MPIRNEACHDRLTRERVGVEGGVSRVGVEGGCRGWVSRVVVVCVCVCVCVSQHVSLPLAGIASETSRAVLLPHFAPPPVLDQFHQRASTSEIHSKRAAADTDTDTHTHTHRPTRKEHCPPRAGRAERTQQETNTGESQPPHMHTARNKQGRGTQRQGTTDQSHPRSRSTESARPPSCPVPATRPRGHAVACRAYWLRMVVLAILAVTAYGSMFEAGRRSSM